MKDDGNSVFTSFNFSSENEIKDMANIIRSKQRKGKSKILLGARLNDVQALLNELADYRKCDENIIFSLDEEKFNELVIEEHSSFRKVTYEDKDFKKNIAAIKLYESMGFVERDKYAFEFV